MNSEVLTYIKLLCKVMSLLQISADFNQFTQNLKAFSSDNRPIFVVGLSVIRGNGYEKDNAILIINPKIWIKHDIYGPLVLLLFHLHLQ